MRSMLKNKCTILLLSLLFVHNSFAHSGGTDSQGGHNDYIHGGYHFHHGNGPHQHPNDQCPLVCSETNTTNATSKWLLVVAGTVIIYFIYKRLR